jgi:hypothetical protein
VIQQSIVENLVDKRLNNIDTQEAALVFIDKVNSIIQKLVWKEGILILIEDNADINKRILTLNINYS